MLPILILIFLFAHNADFNEAERINNNFYSLLGAFVVSILISIVYAFLTPPRTHWFLLTFNESVTRAAPIILSFYTGLIILNVSLPTGIPLIIYLFIAFGAVFISIAITSRVIKEKMEAHVCELKTTRGKTDLNSISQPICKAEKPKIVLLSVVNGVILGGLIILAIYVCFSNVLKPNNLPPNELVNANATSNLQNNANVNTNANANTVATPKRSTPKPANRNKDNPTDANGTRSPQTGNSAGNSNPVLPNPQKSSNEAH